jgi:hypothetical protein
MDQKETQLVGCLHRKVVDRKFHERDIIALLILLRRQTEENSPLRELCDYIAHRDKDRGPIRDYVKHVLDYCKALRSKQSATLAVDVVHTPKSFRSSMNEVLRKYGLSTFDEATANDVLACIMSILQEVRLFHKKKDIGRLRLLCFKTDLWLYGEIQEPRKKAYVRFPALIVPNRYCAIPKSYREFSGVVVAKCVRRQLRLYVNGKKVP